jgi:hypothetical protein
MSSVSSSAEAVRSDLSAPRDGIAGLVDDLLTTCLDHRLQLEWHGGRLRVRCDTEAWQEVSDVAGRKSVLRAVLARLALLCGCSPYGGQGDIAAGSHGTPFWVVFTNTATEQRLELTPQRPTLGTDASEPICTP